MTEEEKKEGCKRGAGAAHLDLGLGGLFKGLGDFLDVLSDMAEKGGEAVSKTGEFEVKGLGEKGQGVYGFSIRSGIGGMPTVERFGNIKTGKEGAEVAEVRVPLVDVFEEEQEIVMVAEMPGVSEDEIQIELTDDVMTIKTTGDRKYEKEVLLPAAIDKETMARSFKNGILELRAKKA